MGGKRYNAWNKDKLLIAIAEFIKRNGQFPTARQMKPTNGLPSRKTFEMLTGMTAFEYGKQMFPNMMIANQRHHCQNATRCKQELKEWTKEALFDAVEHFAKKYGRLPDIWEYHSANGLPRYTVFCKIAEKAMAKDMQDTMSHLCQSSITQDSKKTKVKNCEQNANIMDLGC